MTIVLHFYREDIPIIAALRLNEVCCYLRKANGGDEGVVVRDWRVRAAALRGCSQYIDHAFVGRQMDDWLHRNSCHGLQPYTYRPCLILSTLCLSSVVKQSYRTLASRNVSRESSRPSICLEAPDTIVAVAGAGSRNH